MNKLTVDERYLRITDKILNIEPKDSEHFQRLCKALHKSYWAWRKLKGPARFIIPIGENENV